MIADPVEAIARAVLYEGYLLYPYTRSAVKNQVRWTFGGLHPPSWEADPSAMQTECLLRAGTGCRVRIQVRCLQLVRRSGDGDPSWQEAAERTVADLEHAADELVSRPVWTWVELPPGRSEEDGVVREWEAIRVKVTLVATARGPVVVLPLPVSGRRAVGKRRLRRGRPSVLLGGSGL